MKVAIIGGTGNLGQPVAHALKQAGMDVTIITRDIESARNKMGKQLSYRQASLEDIGSLTAALKGMDAVHINLSGFTKIQCDQNIRQGTQNLIQAAKKTDICLISFISGATVNEKNQTEFFDIQAKHQAELSIKNSGIPYLIFCPSWFMESLPNFINSGRASIFGAGEKPIYWLTANDYARQLVACYKNPEQRNKRIVLHGPNALNLTSAMEIYLQHLHPDLELGHAPYFLGSLLSWLTGDKKIKYAAKLSQYYENLNSIHTDSEEIKVMDSGIKEWCEGLKETGTLLKAVS